MTIHLDFKEVVLAAVCSEQPRADIKAIKNYLKNAYNESPRSSTVYMHLGYLEDEGLIRHEEREADNEKLFFPTHKGQDQNSAFVPVGS